MLKYLALSLKQPIHGAGWGPLGDQTSYAVPIAPLDGSLSYVDVRL
jgi:hypothetical protein